ncbi:UNVERIFIED_ORG: hypothetical protein FHR63_000719 [Xanthomonas campestris]
MSPAGSDSRLLLATDALNTVCWILACERAVVLNHAAACGVTAPLPNTLNGTQPSRASAE